MRRFQPTQSKPVGVLWENGCSFSGRMSKATADVMDGLLPACNNRGKTKTANIKLGRLGGLNTAFITEHLFPPLMPAHVSSTLVDTWMIMAREVRKQHYGRENCKVRRAGEVDNQVLDSYFAYYPTATESFTPSSEVCLVGGGSLSPRQVTPQLQNCFLQLYD